VIVLGFDPGITGAVAVLVDDKIVSVIDMPVVEKRIASGKMRRRVSAAGIADIINNRIFSPNTGVEAWVEQVSPRPGEGTVSSFSFGRSVGVIEGVLAGLGVPTNFVAPPVWMKELRVPRDGSIGRCLEIYPYLAKDLSRKKDHGRADAALIALFGSRDSIL
jgi:crossover junction endodeoxyribonuclease RuvC